MEQPQTNPMRAITINKVVLNIGTGHDDNMQANAKRLLNMISGRDSADEISKRRNPAFKITKGQKIGAFVTLRGKLGREVLKRLLDAVDNKVKPNAITKNSMSFGIREYIDISGLKYDPKIGMMGLNVNVSFRRRGTRVSLRKRQRAEVPKKHREIAPEEITDYMTREFNIAPVAE
ncbi:MAG: 50S ribosomal protein L5 [Candidatus Micrarchaeota archaeon]|nr:50S ribosomal protein L5 [Candidatus Micrarchaeota archaeon]